MTLAVLALATVGVCAQVQQPEPSPNPVVVLQTEKGAIEIEVDSRRAPITAGCRQSHSGVRDCTSLTGLKHVAPREGK